MTGATTNALRAPGPLNYANKMTRRDPLVAQVDCGTAVAGHETGMLDKKAPAESGDLREKLDRTNAA